MQMPSLTLGRVVLRVPPGGTNAPHWRWRAERALSRVTLDAGLPPRAILVVRHLPEVAPGALLTDAQRWNGAAQAWLRDCWRRAARPAFGPVSPSADAVWFADEAEWLACLSWDTHQNLASSRWWWRAWLRQRRDDAAGPALDALWSSSPRWLPQATALLYERYASGLNTLFLRLLPAEARRVRQLVQQAYDLPPLDRAALAADALLQALPAGVQRMARALPGETAALLMVCLAVTHAPSALQQVRRAEHPDLAHGQTETPARGMTQAAAGPDGPPPAGHVTAAPVSAADSPGDAAGQPVDGRAAPARPPDSRAGAPVGVSAPADAAPRRGAASPPRNLPSDRPPVLARDARGAGAGAAGAASPDPAEAPSGPALPELRTGLGGLWYLVNALVDLEWPGPALNAWHRLAWLARALLDAAPVDPVWEMLAEQAGEEADEAALRAWLAAVSPALQAYLQARLEQPAALAAALRDPARLYVTRTHIDVMFRLDQIRLDLRLAGLDRDPGWVPELAHVVTLHYE